MDKVGSKTLTIMKSAPFYNKWLLSLIKPYLHGDILEVGGGIGNFTPYLKKYGEVISIDIEKLYIKKLKKITTAGFGDIEANKYFFKSKKFDSIVCLNVLEHIENDEKALHNMYSLLKPGGKLILLVPAHQRAYTKMDSNLGHFRRYTKQNLKTKFENSKFKVIKVRYYNLPGVIGWFVNGKLLRKKIIPKNQLGIFDKVFIPWLLIEKKVNVPLGLSVLIVGQK